MRTKTGYTQASFDNYGFIPPHDVGLEEVILGALILDGESIELAMPLIKEEMFYKDSHQKIFHAICLLREKAEEIDLITVTKKIKELGLLEAVGGAFYITQLMSRVVSSANIQQWASSLVFYFTKRELIRLGMEITKNGYDETTPIEDTIALIDKNFIDITNIQSGASRFSHICNIVKQCLEKAYEREVKFKRGIISGITTGLYELDRLTNGWQNSELIILAARPSMGKTALMLHFAKAAAKAGKSVCIYSLEMSDISLVNRLLLSETNVPAAEFRRGNLSEDDWLQLKNAERELAKLPIYIDDNPMVNMRYIENHSRMMHNRGRCDIIFADYLQLADVVSGKNTNREQDIAKASRDCKLIAKKLNVPFVLLSQLSRQVEGRADKKPLLSDLRESGAIEQDADVVTFVFRPEYYGFLQDSDGNSVKGVAKLIIEKNRNAAIGEIKVNYNESLTKFYDFNSEGMDTPF